MEYLISLDLPLCERDGCCHSDMQSLKAAIGKFGVNDNIFVFYFEKVSLYP